MQRRFITPLLLTTLIATTFGSGVHAAQQAAPSAQATQRKSLDPSRDPQADWRSINIADLTDNEGVQEKLQALGRAELDEAEEALAVFLRRRETARATANSLLQAIRRHAQPPFDDRNQVRLDGLSELQVSATPEHQAWIESFLVLQRSDKRFVSMEAMHCRIPFGTASGLGLKETRQVLSSVPIRELKAKLLASPETNLVSMPRVAVQPLQLATIQLVNQKAYVKDYELITVEPNARKFASPIIGTLEEGFECKLRAVPLGGKTYSVEVDFEHSRLVNMREFESTLGGVLEEPVTFSLPEIARVQLKSWPALEFGQGLVLLIPDEDAGYEHLMILELIEADPEDPNSPF